MNPKRVYKDTPYRIRVDANIKDAVSAYPDSCGRGLSMRAVPKKMVFGSSLKLIAPSLRGAKRGGDGEKRSRAKGKSPLHSLHNPPSFSLPPNPLPFSTPAAALLYPVFASSGHPDKI